MARRNRSPLKYIANITPEADQRELIIKRLKEDLIYVHEREKQFSVLQSYYVTMIEKSKLLDVEKSKIQGQQKVRIQSAQRTINELKKQVDIYKNEIKSVNSQLLQSNEQYDELKKLKNNREIEIDKWKKEAMILQQEHSLLLKDMSDLKSDSQLAQHENQRFILTLHDLEDRFALINGKIAEAKKYIQELQLEQNEFKERLKKYEQDNNLLSENIGNKEENIDQIEGNFQLKHDEIKQNIEHFIELEHADDKVKREILHVNHIIKNENEKTNELNNIIQKSEKGQYDKINEIKNIGIESAEIEAANRQINQNNEMLKRDLQKCQQHLENLMKQNSALQQYLENHLREDEAIINVITRKTLPYMKSNSRRNTGF